MDAFMSPLRGWRLETTYDDIGQRHHQLKSGAECWRTVKCLGNGSFGDVWEEHCVSGPSPNAIRAVKHLRKRQSKFLEMSKREIQALVTFSDSHTPEYKQHFVQFLGWFDDLENVYIAMEFLQYGDLQKFIKAPFPEPEAASIVFQVAQALQYMHRKNFVHRDIKPLNILVSSPGPKWHVKVADFGITKNTDGSALGTHYIGSPGYMAPELYGDSSNHYTAAIDVWALGAVAFCLRTGAPPFRTIKHLLDYSRDHRVQFPLRPLGNSSGFCMNFVLGTMADPAERRLTIDHVLAHDWLSGQSDSLEGGSLGGNSAESQATWEIAPSNAWSNTYDNTATQRPRSSSSTEPLSKPNPKADITPLTVPSLSPPLQEHVSKDQLATEMGNLKLMDSKPGDNEMTATIRPKAARDKSPNTIKAMTDLAATYHKQKKFDQAESIFEEVVSLRREVFGNEHLETINALAQLAATYREQKKYKESEPIDEEIVTLRREKYGDEHPDTVKAMENLVITYREQKKVGQVAQISKQLSLLQQKSLGRPHTHTIDSLGSQDETFQEAEKIAFGDTSDQLDLRLTVVAADRLPKQDFFRFPSPFAVVLVDGKKVFTTSVNLKTLSPYWNDTVDLRVNRKSILAIQVFDERNSKRKYQGFLGALSFLVGDVIGSTKEFEKILIRDLNNLEQSLSNPGRLRIMLSNLSTNSRLLISDDPLIEPASSSEYINGYVKDKNVISTQLGVLPPLKPVFGISLNDLYSRDGNPVPSLLYQCFQAIELFGLDMEAIYRLSGDATHMQNMKARFDNDSSQMDLTDPENFYYDINSVAGLVKQFFRDLPDPLFTSQYYSQFLDAARLDDDIQRRDQLHALINDLPDAHYATLRATIFHFNKVQEHSSQNRMNAGNLAICFGSTLMGMDGSNIADAGWQVRVIESVIVNTLQIFLED